MLVAVIYECISLSWACKDHSQALHTPANAEMEWASVHHWEGQFHLKMNCFQREKGEEEGKKKHSLDCYLRVDG